MQFNRMWALVDNFEACIVGERSALALTGGPKEHRVDVAYSFLYAEALVLPGMAYVERAY